MTRGTTGRPVEHPLPLLAFQPGHEEERVDDLEIPAGDVEGHRLAANDNETVVPDADDEPPVDVEGHRLAGNDNETLVEDD
jgi:hypothetical protein